MDRAVGRDTLVFSVRREQLADVLHDQVALDAIASEIGDGGLDHRHPAEHRKLVQEQQDRLSGGGYLSSEYPLIIRVKYRDVNGDEAEYVRGFYAQNDTSNPTANGELLPRATWIPFDSSNLLASLPIKPFRILSIEIYASGWDYESYISNVRLKAE